MLLSELAHRIGADVVGADARAHVEVLRAEHDSRAVQPGTLFCCVRGATTDGHIHAPEAVARGAVALLVDHELRAGVPELVVDDVRAEMGPVAAAVAGDPSIALTVVGVTGTNGKTTTTLLLEAIALEAGRRAAVLGTLSGPRTTPEAPELQRWFAARRDEGVEIVAMEVSSHALVMHRVDGTHFAAAVFTNLSPEHLDFHGTMEAYFEAKAGLFEPGRCEIGVVNGDDPFGRRLIDDASVPVRVFSPDAFAADPANEVRDGVDGTTFRWRGRPVRLGLGGRHNLANALAAAEVAAALGIDDDVIARGLSRPLVIPGRFERIEAGQPFTVLVDFAHTPDALARVLDAASHATDEGLVRVVFGCGGDRDAEKRPLMGAVAARGADEVVLTADNSRSESTATIIEAILGGAATVAAPRARSIAVDEDRARAIAGVIGAAAPGDVVVIAGKGHEQDQIIGDRVMPFDDRAEARRALATAGWVAADVASSPGDPDRGATR